MTLADQPILLGLRSRWSRLSPRDRMILGGLGVVIALALIYLTLWLPAASGIDEVNRELTGLRAEHAKLVDMANEARRLRGARSHDLSIAVADRAASVLRTIDRAGLAGPPAPEVTSDETGAVVARFADVDYAGWILWLGRAETELGASALKVAISELPTSAGAGHVRAEVTLTWAEKKGPATAPAGNR
jgi:type II secretory pathway component PulM